MRKESCWMCQGDQWIEKDACYYCERSMPHASCDYSIVKNVKCPICSDDNEDGGGKLAKLPRKPKTPSGAKL